MTSLPDEMRVQRGITDLAVEHYELLSYAQRAAHEVGCAATEALHEIAPLDKSLVRLQQDSHDVIHASQRWRAEKEILSGAVLHHSKLLALMDAPALVMECIQNEMYSEALLIFDHVMPCLRCSGQYSLFQRLDEAMRQTMRQSLRTHLLARLMGPLTVEVAFKIVLFMQRLGIAGAALRRLLLRQRDRYVMQLIKDADAVPAVYSRLLRYIALYRVHVSEVVLQYTTCFPTASGDGVITGLAGTATDALLAAWCERKTRWLRSVLHSDITRLTSGVELAMIVEQCHNCSALTAKARMDMSSFVNDILVQRVGQIFVEQISNSEMIYRTCMLTYSWRDTTFRTPSLHGETTTCAIGDVQYGSDAAGERPPACLTQWLPLAYAMNGLLTSFNAVRRCLVAGAELTVGAAVARFIGLIAADLIRDAKLLATMEATEREAFVALVNAFVRHFCPYALHCTALLLGASTHRRVHNELFAPLHLLQSYCGVNVTRCSGLDNSIVATADNAETPPRSQTRPTTDLATTVAATTRVEEAKHDNNFATVITPSHTDSGRDGTLCGMMPQS